MEMARRADGMEGVLVYVDRRDQHELRRAAIKRRIVAVANRHGARDSDRRIIVCVTSGSAGKSIRKVVYAPFRSAQRAVIDMQAITGAAPQFIYRCGEHYHLTTKAPRQGASQDRPIELPRSVLKSAGHARRYRRKCGVAATMLEFNRSAIGIDELAQTLEWPLGRTPHGNDGRRVLRDLLDSLQRDGLVKQSGDSVMVVRPGKLRRLAWSAELLD